MTGKVGKLTARRIGREAAHDDLVSHELCCDLAGELARDSAQRTGDQIGDIRYRYEAIANELRAVRYAQVGGKRYSLSTVLYGTYESDAVLKEFLRYVVGEYVSDCMREHTFDFSPLYRQTRRTWILCRHEVRRELLPALTEEYTRDREGLLRFLSAVFKRWRKIDQPHSAFRMKVVTEQCANGVPHHRIARQLEKIRAAPKGTVVPGTPAYRKLRSKIKKIRSRDRKSAVEKKGKALARETTPPAELKAWLECASCRSKWTHSISICPHCEVPVRKARR